MNDPQFRERLDVPLWWWLIGLFLAASLVLAVVTFLGPAWGAASALAGVGVVAAALVPWHRTIVSADEAGLRAGGAHIDWRWVRSARALHAEAAHRRLSIEADPADWLLVRPYVRTLVEVRLDDPADPHPAWLVSSRRAQALADVVNSRAGHGSTDPGRHAGDDAVGRLDASRGREP